MIERLIEEMFETCHACQGVGEQEVDIGEYKECSICNGDGYDLSYLGLKLQRAILKGEKE